jgi:hypothetical protein
MVRRFEIKLDFNLGQNRKINTGTGAQREKRKLCIPWVTAGWRYHLS